MEIIDVLTEQDFQRVVYEKTYKSHPENFQTKDDWDRAEQFVIDTATEEELHRLEIMGII